MIYGIREVSLTIQDTQTGVIGKVKTTYPQDFDDHEIIYRLISGVASCDCVRGQILYGDKQPYECNNGLNRFVLKKMAIHGKPYDCVMTFRRYE